MRTFLFDTPTCTRRIRTAMLGCVLGAALSACTPVRVLTHSVSPDESTVQPGRYTLDPHHWNVSFDVEHFKYSRFVMRFDKVTGDLNWPANGIEQSSVNIVIDASSLDTNVPILDKMVKGPQMLDAEQFSSIQFKSTQFHSDGDDKGTLVGDLTLHGVTRPITLSVHFNGHSPDPLNKLETLGFSAEGTFSRAQFGLATWYPAVGDDVHVAIQAEFVSKAGNAP